MRKRDAIVLLLICGFVVLNAGALRLGGSMRAKTLMCTVNLDKIGRACNMYSEQYDGKLPLLEYYADIVPSIQSTYLLSRSSPYPASYRHLGCLYGAGYVGDGQLLFCPATPEWRSRISPGGNNNGTYLGAIHSSTGVFADIRPGVSQPAQGWKATLGYCYWPLSKHPATQADIGNIYSGNRSLYVAGLPLNATKSDDLDTTRPIVADRKFHGSVGLRWSLSALYPDGRVVMQPQPMKNGLGMYSLDENNQFTSDVWNYPAGFIDPAEAARNLPTGVTPTEFAWSLQSLQP